MRRVKIFSGTSSPGLCDQICERLGTSQSKCEVKKFSNGETSVNIGCSIRNQDVFIVQGGSGKVNDSIMETLILISACKGGSANKVTAVMPYFPYSKQSKKKSHRGAITARMLANLLTVAGVDHVVTVDLHASQMQGFFTRPVDNLSAEPLFAKWIRQNVENWREAVAVSKNPGGTKRVTSLADALKINFALITTDKRRAMHESSAWQSRRPSPAQSENDPNNDVPAAGLDGTGNFPGEKEEDDPRFQPRYRQPPLNTYLQHRRGASGHDQDRERNTKFDHIHRVNGLGLNTQVNPRHVPHPDSHMSPREHEHRQPHNLSQEASHTMENDEGSGDEQDYNDEQVSDVTTGRLVSGHIVDDDYPSPSMTASLILEKDEDGNVSNMMTTSMYSTASSVILGPEAQPLGGTMDARASDDEEDGPTDEERMITMVGEVKNRTALIVDDMIDRAGSWVAAAEHAVKRCGAKKVYCLATHGLFGEGCLAEMDECKCIDKIVITSSFTFSDTTLRKYKKLVVLDLSYLLSEAIRRNHHGESIRSLRSSSPDPWADLQSVYKNR